MDKSLSITGDTFSLYPAVVFIIPILNCCVQCDIPRRRPFFLVTVRVRIDMTRPLPHTRGTPYILYSTDLAPLVSTEFVVFSGPLGREFHIEILLLRAGLAALAVLLLG